MNRWPWLLVLLGALSCKDGRVTSPDDVSAAVRALPEAALQKVARKRIYFGHQSVGDNLVAGLQAVARERPEAGLRIVEGRTPEALGAAAFAHAKNGRNEAPLTKIEDFAATMDGGLGAAADVAFFKLCYVDLTPGADVEGVFGEYRRTLARLRAAHPSVAFVHVTAPLTVVEAGPKAFVKRLLGKPLWGAEANAVRERFNALMRQEYEGKEPLFDLARVESQRADGGTVTFTRGGEEVRALAAEYASDGKHLNDVGARWAAVHLLQLLATLPE